MSDTPAPVPPVPTAVPATPLPTQSTANLSPKNSVNTDETTPDTTSDDVAPTKKFSTVTLGLMTLSVILLLILLFVSLKLNTRNTTITQAKNHTTQMETNSILMKAQLDTQILDNSKLQTQVEESKESTIKLTANIDKLKAEAIELQDRVAKAVLVGSTYQLLMEDAKVDAIRQHGLRTLAQANEAIKQAQLLEAQTDTERIQTQLTISRTDVKVLTEKLEKIEKQVDALKGQKK